MVNTHKKVFQTEDINLFVYKIIYRLEKERALMTYSLSDFEYYFSHGTTISRICHNTGIKQDIVRNYFIEWAEKNKQEQKDVIKTYIVSKTELKSALQNGPKNEKEETTLMLYKRNFFNVVI